MTGESGLFFGPTERSLFGVVHWPERVGGAGVVICPPLGYELVCAHHGLRLLAQELASLGHPVLRFDYDGTGNSIGELGAVDVVAAWRRSLARAVSELRSMGVANVVLVGLRYGATLAAAEVLKRIPGVTGMVLWDPVVSGRRYARSLRFLSVEAHEADAVVVGGVTYSKAILAEIAASSIATTEYEIPTLLMQRVGPGSSAQVLGADEITCEGMADFIDCDAETSTIPRLAIADIVNWINQTVGDAGESVVGAIEGSPIRITASERCGQVSLQHRCCRFGDGAIFGVETRPEPVDEGLERGALVFLNNGVAPQIGPGRAWVEFARGLAEVGWRVLRVDLSGLGNSSPRGDGLSNDSYPISAAQDVRDVVDELTRTGSTDVVIVGLCSGSLLAYDASLQCQAIRAVVAINGRFDRPFTDDRPSRSIRAARPTNRWLAVPLGKSPLFPYFARVPTAAWRFMNLTRLVASPSVAISRAAHAGVGSLLIFGVDEWGLNALHQRDGRRFTALCESPLVDLVIIQELDHSMFRQKERRAVFEIVRSYLDSLGSD